MLKGFPPQKLLKSKNASMPSTTHNSGGCCWGAQAATAQAIASAKADKDKTNWVWHPKSFEYAFLDELSTGRLLSSIRLCQETTTARWVHAWKERSIPGHTGYPVLVDDVSMVFMENLPYTTWHREQQEAVLNGYMQNDVCWWFPSQGELGN